MQNLILYDAECPLCTFQMRLLTWLDWFNVAAFLPIASPQAALVAPGLSQEDLRLAIHCVTPCGRIYRGARSIRYLALRMPLLWPFGFFLWIPGVIQIAEAVYRFISRRRYVLSRLFGCKQACALLPSRPGKQPLALEERPLSLKDDAG